MEGDDSFIPFREFTVGCEASAEEYEELLENDIDGIGLSPWTGGQECGLKVVTYHVVPLSQRMRVESAVWRCFTESRDLRDPNDVSCAGRFTFLERQVKWLPGRVSYTIVEGAEHRDRFTSLIPWINEKLGIEVSESDSADSANLFLHLGASLPGNCGEAYGCNTWEEGAEGTFAAIFIAAPDEFFSQVLKHELLHALIPMGHLPEGDYLMSKRPPDPSRTHTLSALEEKLLRLYANPYLRDGMTMEQFSRYLIIEEDG